MAEFFGMVVELGTSPTEPQLAINTGAASGGDYLAFVSASVKRQAETTEILGTIHGACVKMPKYLGVADHFFCRKP